MAINKLVALVTILALIPTSVISPDITEHHQTQAIDAPDNAENLPSQSMASSDNFQCVDHLKSLLNPRQLSAHLQFVNCLETNELTFNQCFVRQISPVMRSSIAMGEEEQYILLIHSVVPLEFDQIPNADREVLEYFWRERATSFGCVF